MPVIDLYVAGLNPNIYLRLHPWQEIGDMYQLGASQGLFKKGFISIKE